MSSIYGSYPYNAYGPAFGASAPSNPYSLGNSISEAQGGVAFYLPIVGTQYAWKNSKNIGKGRGFWGAFKSDLKRTDKGIKGIVEGENAYNAHAGLIKQRRLMKEYSKLYFKGGAPMSKEMQELARDVYEGKNLELASEKLAEFNSKAGQNAAGFFSKAKDSIKAPLKPLFESKAWGVFSGSKIGKLLKQGGAGTFAVLEGIIATATEIIPAFQQAGLLGGLKQICKSSVNVAAGVGGFIGGEALCAPLGAMLGSALGPIGTMIGGFIGGIAGGFILSSQAKRVARGIVGKSVVENINENQFNGYPVNNPFADTINPYSSIS